MAMLPLGAPAQNGDEVIVMKDQSGRVIGFEEEHLKFAFETVEM